jgi:glycosyltransferase involved in cell wall biosynthesis
MRITIDASSMMPPRTGVGRYTYELVKALVSLDQINDYVLFCNSLRRPLPNEEALVGAGRSEIMRRRIPGPWLHGAWRVLGWPPMERLAGRSDIVHAPASILPPRGDAARVVTLHDCYFMRHPEQCGALGGLYMRKTLPTALHTCDAVLCVSEFTRDEALDLFDLDPSLLHVTRLGVDRDRFHPVTDVETIEAVRRELNLPHEFFLTVATLEPRKNLAGAIRGMAHLRSLLATPPKLVCVGAQGSEMGNLRRLVRNLGLGNDVFFTGPVRGDLLPALYSMALALIEPSFYEGFGLPVLEAMACGTPVVANNIPALREVGGDAVRLVDATDPESLARDLKDLAESPARRVAMSRAGLEHSATFSWRQTARETLGVYNMLRG